MSLPSITEDELRAEWGRLADEANPSVCGDDWWTRDDMMRISGTSKTTVSVAIAKGLEAGTLEEGTKIVTNKSGRRQRKPCYRRIEAAPKKRGHK